MVFDLEACLGSVSTPGGREIHARNRCWMQGLAGSEAEWILTRMRGFVGDAILIYSISV